MNETVKIWTELAMSDLKSSQLLYDHKQFRTSYFLFQQASEKANKAFALFSGQWSEKDVKTILHDQLKIFKKTIVKQETELKALIQVLEPIDKLANHKILFKANLSDYRNSLLESVELIDSLKNHDLVNISLTDLNHLLRQLKNAKELKIRIPINYEKKFKEILLNVADWVGQFQTPQATEEKQEILKMIKDEAQTKEFSELMLNQIFPAMIDIIFINLTFYFCAIITIQHSTLSRYPDNSKNPIDIYTMKLPLIKKQNEFMGYLHNALNKFASINAL